MLFDVEEQVHYNIANTPVRRYPFAHFYVDPVFPTDFYRELLARLAPLSVYKRLADTGVVAPGAYPQRYICSIEDLKQYELTEGLGTFWAELAAWLMADRFATLILNKFAQEQSDRFGRNATVSTSFNTRFVRDFTHYSISPHTDSPRKLVSLLFYLPEDRSLAALGTSIYLPLDPNLSCQGTKHHQFEAFKKVVTMPFAPNTMLGFFKTDQAFHGVDEIETPDVTRNVMLYNMNLEQVVTPDVATPKPSWFSRFK